MLSAAPSMREDHPCTYGCSRKTLARDTAPVPIRVSFRNETPLIDPVLRPGLHGAWLQSQLEIHKTNRGCLALLPRSHAFSLHI